MKMSDVFELPVCAPVSTDDELVDDFCGYIAEFASRDTAKAAAHAINCHDGLVESLDWLLHNAKKLLVGQPARDMDECINRAEIQLRKALEDAPR